MVAKILTYLPYIIAPALLFIFSIVSAFVFKFRYPRGGLGFDYIIFTVVVVAALLLGGAI